MQLQRTSRQKYICISLSRFFFVSSIHLGIHPVCSEPDRNKQLITAVERKRFEKSIVLCFLRTTTTSGIAWRRKTGPCTAFQKALPCQFLSQCHPNLRVIGADIYIRDNSQVNNTCSSRRTTKKGQVIRSSLVFWSCLKDDFLRQKYAS